MAQKIVNTGVELREREPNSAQYNQTQKGDYPFNN